MQFSVQRAHLQFQRVDHHLMRLFHRLEFFGRSSVFQIQLSRFFQFSRDVLFDLLESEERKEQNSFRCGGKTPHSLPVSVTVDSTSFMAFVSSSIRLSRASCFSFNRLRFSVSSFVRSVA